MKIAIASDHAGYPLKAILADDLRAAGHDVLDLAVPALVVVSVAMLIPLACFPVLLRVGRLPRADAASIAAHYGSVSVVTFAVGSAYLSKLGEQYEGYMAVFLVLLEFPALVIGVLLARRGEAGTPWGKVLHEVESTLLDFDPQAPDPVDELAARRAVRSA